MLTSYVQGVGTAGALIVAIGAQNAFVLTQGIQRNHHGLVALICMGCDAIFISIGMAGGGTLLTMHPLLTQGLLGGGAAFLFCYGVRAFFFVIQGHSLQSGRQGLLSRKGVVFATFSVTLLNPHFYLDTCLLLGGLGARFAGIERTLFWLGAVSASVLWFSLLSYAGGLLAPIFHQERAWRWLDCTVGITMWLLAFGLCAEALELLHR